MMIGFCGFACTFLSGQISKGVYMISDSTVLIYRIELLGNEVLNHFVTFVLFFCVIKGC